MLNPGQVVVSGLIGNPTDHTITLLALEITGRVSHVAKVDSAGRFNFQFQTLSAHDNYLIYDGQSARIFLEPNDSSYVVADGADFKHSIEYHGSQAKFNQCLKIFFRELGQELKSGRFFKKEMEMLPREFVAYAADFFDRMHVKVDSINRIVAPNSEKPKEWLHTWLKYRQVEDLLEYGKYRRNEIDSAYYDFIADYQEPEKYAIECSQFFEDFIRKYYFGYKVGLVEGFRGKISGFEDGTCEGWGKMAGFIDSMESSQLAKQIMLTRKLSTILDQNHLLADSIFPNYRQVITDTTCHNFIAKRISEKGRERHVLRSWSELEEMDFVGKVFKEIRQIHGKKVMYIDFWGTWCRPCVKALPYINKLRDELDGEKVAFVFFCVKSSEVGWEKAKKAYQLKGTHYLLTDDQYAILSEQFGLYSIPRYMLIDRNGDVVDANAKPPHDSAMKDELKTLMEF